MATATIKDQATQAGTDIPDVSDRLVYWFDWYLQRYFPKHFHAFAVSNTSAIDVIPQGVPLIVYLNHASWWDPLVALVLARRYFPDRHLYAPIDAIALKKYPFMERLGFFAVEQSSLHGAGQFLKTARVILRQRNSSVWLTPEGQFADPRQRDLTLQPGLAHLATRLDEGYLLPIAVEYPFWEERLPEVLVRFGEPFSIAEHAGVSKEGWQRMLETGLRTTQVDLESDSLARRSEAFSILISGTTGVDWIYDALRRVRSLFTGEGVAKTHGEKLQ